MTTSQLAHRAGSSQISDLLVDLVGPRLCLVEIKRAEGCFTFAVDAEWAEMGMDLMATSCSGMDCSAQLPRSALRAVIAGWPAQWDMIEKPRLEVHLSEDLVPHISLSADQPLADLSD